MGEDKIVLDKEILTKIQSRATAIKLISNDKQIIKEASEILSIIEEQFKVNSVSLLERINQKMKETKLSNPELNANLYILYRKLSDNKISEEDAAVLYDLYVSSEPFDKKIY
ncbi:hypothetical protein [Clostridium rectalis]|uniref:hypothetical protein n=1 Tax=Clostridium rectalis TaxID=2040295 RepID=UPI000F6444BC|nr:hypothetical protein [Clostridium rectalis]